MLLLSCHPKFSTRKVPKQLFASPAGKECWHHDVWSSEDIWGRRGFVPPPSFERLPFFCSFFRWYWGFLSLHCIFSLSNVVTLHESESERWCFLPQYFHQFLSMFVSIIFVFFGCDLGASLTSTLGCFPRLLNERGWRWLFHQKPEIQPLRRSKAVFSAYCMYLILFAFCFVSVSV